MTNNDSLYRYNNELFEAAMNTVKQLLNSKKVGWLITIIGMYLTGFPPENEKQQGNTK